MGGGDGDFNEGKVPDITLPFDILASKDNYEIRSYPLYPVVSVKYDKRDEGMSSLIAYLEGGNEGAVEYPATQPLVNTYYRTNDGFVKSMELYLGPKAETPSPPTVPWKQVGTSGGVFAVRSFDGPSMQKNVEPNLKKLMADLEADGISVPDANEFRLAMYGPIYSLMPTKKEVWLKVDFKATA